MDELNKKLGEWVGFEFSWGSNGKLYDHRYIKTFSFPKDFIARSRFFQPDCSNFPDFTHSLDACFRWLVPKLGYYLITDTNGKEEAMVWLDGDVFEARGKTPTLALCKAIEKLIDWDSK